MKRSIFLLLIIVLCSNLFALDYRPLISNLEVRSSENNTEIVLTWNQIPDQVAEKIQNLLVYRSTTAFCKASQLTEDNLIATLQITETTFSDTVKDYKNYYYAIIAELTDSSLYDIMIPSVNTTVYPVGLAAKEDIPVLPVSEEEKKPSISSSGLREAPLPYLQVLPNQAEENTETIPDQVLNKANTLIKSTVIRKLPTPDIFPEEKEDRGTMGDDYILFSIIDAFFTRGDWKSANNELEKFIQMNRDEKVLSRAYYYLGQANYFLGNTQAALSYFMKAEKEFSHQSKKWIQEVLSQ